MNERIKELYEQAHIERRQEYFSSEVDPTIKSVSVTRHFDPDFFAELIIEDMHKKVIASILITDVVMEEKGQVPTSEDYIRAINKDFGVEE